MQSGSPSVFVVIPNKNGREHLCYSLPSLFAGSYDNLQVLLVDDGSSDGSPAWVREQFPQVEVLASRGKKGFAGTVNTGIRHALARGACYVAVFNSDIKVLPQWLQLALPGFARAPRVGLVGFTEITPEREELFYRYHPDPAAVQFRSVPGLAGCLYLCARELFESIGLFDEDYFMYGEDNDFLYRTCAAGFGILETDVPVWHFGEGAHQKNRLLPTWLAYRNALRFAIKNQSLFGIARMTLSLVNLGCNPFLKRPADHPVIRRMRRYHPLCNVFLILGSALWNLWHLGATLAARAGRR